MTTTQQPDPHVIAVRDLAVRLCTVAAENAPTHKLMLDALMAAYVATAEVHTCCTAEAARVAARCAARLAHTARTAPPAAHIH